MLLYALALVAALPAADEARYEQLWTRAHAACDTTRGGWVAKDGAPVEAAIELGFRFGADRPASRAHDLAAGTLDWTLGLFDSVGGGFYSRARDADPSAASFEKMTIPNARRLELLITAWSRTGDERWKSYAARTVDYFDRVLLDGRGGFTHGQVGEQALVPESNGEAIRAWLLWAAATGNHRQRDFAWKSLDRTWEECWMEGPGLVRRGTFREITEAPRLMDQVAMGRAYLAAAHLAGRERDLERAAALGDLVLTVYADPKGGFKTRALLNKQGVVKSASRELDENARAARFLAELATITGQNRYRDAARAALDAFEKKVEKMSAAEAAEVALALRALTLPDLPERPEWSEDEAEESKPRTQQSTRFKLKRRR